MSGMQESHNSGMHIYHLESKIININICITNL